MSSYWKEIKNDYRETNLDSEFEKGIKTIAYIDAWRTDDDNEEGEVIAKIVVTDNNQIFVIYISNVARGDKYAQEKIKETMEELTKEYPTESFEKTLNNIQLITRLRKVAEELNLAIIKEVSIQKNQSNIESYIQEIKTIADKLKV